MRITDRRRGEGGGWAGYLERKWSINMSRIEE